MKQDTQMDALLNCGNIIRGYVYQDGKRKEYWFDGEPQNIASFLMLHGEADRVVLTDMMDMLVLNTYTDYLTKYGYIDYCPYGSLHSTGMLECEAPVFSVTNKRVIEEGMAICIDAYFKGMEWGSFRVEDCYLITADGAKRMTTYNDKAIPKIFK